MDEGRYARSHISFSLHLHIFLACINNDSRVVILVADALAMRPRITFVEKHSKQSLHQWGQF